MTTALREMKTPQIKIITPPHFLLPSLCRGFAFIRLLIIKF